MSNEIWKISVFDKPSGLSPIGQAGMPVLPKENPPPDSGSWQRVLKVPGCERLVTPAFSPQPTRCLDANDGWHDGVCRGGCACC